MKRKHIHLSSNLDDALAVGSRYGEPAVFLIDTFKMIEDGFKFYVSPNNIWLIDYVPSKYLSLLDNKFINRNKNLVNISVEVKEKFLKDLFEVYKRFGVSISHEN